MEDKLGDDFMTFATPVFRGVDWDLFEGVKMSYKKEVLNVVTRMASEHKEEVMKLAEGMLPHLRTVIARQRRDYGIDEERFPSQYPVESQSANIDQTPVHNLAAERACWKIDYRLKRTHSLPPVSWQMILQRYGIIIVIIFIFIFIFIIIIIIVITNISIIIITIAGARS